MKKIFLLVLILSFFSSYAEWVNISENQSNKLFTEISSESNLAQIQFTLSGYENEKITCNGVDFQKFSYFNEGEFLEIGKPDLPRFSRLIAIPDESDVSVSIEKSDFFILENIEVYPRQNLQSESRENDRSFVIDEDFYKHGNVFPEQVVQIGEPAIMRDFRVVRLTVNPFQYNPQTKELKIYRNMKIKVEFNGFQADNQKLIHHKKSRAFEPLYRSAIINYDSITDRDEEYQKPSYLFIYPSNLNNDTTLQDLVNWKHEKGFLVTAVSTSVTGSSTNSIKSYIQNAYNTWENPPEYICLIGDAGGSYNIPTWHESWSGYNGEGDHPYSQLEGNDILADAIIGRISFNTLFQFQTIADKIFHYEKIPYMENTNWYRKTLMVGDPSQSGISTVITKRSIKEMIDRQTENFTQQEVYSGSFVSQMSNGFNSGIGFFNYRGYLGMSGWENYNTNALNNGYMLPYVVTITCGTGSFEGTSDATTEGFLKAGAPGSPKGGIGSVGTATWGTHTCFNNCVDGGIYYGIFTDKIYTMGGSLLRGKLSLYLNYPDDPHNKVEIFSYWNNLMGDPGLELWTNIPKEIEVTNDSEISVGTNYFPVTVVDTAHEPVSNAWVTLLEGDDDIFATGFTDENGEIIFPVFVANSGTAKLTVTGHNLKPHFSTINIAQAGVFVNITNTTVDDDNNGESSGNDDGLINPGENIELAVDLHNFGSNDANSVSASISSDSEIITITDDSENFGNIPAGGTAASEDDFDFSVSPNALGGAEIVFDVQITDNSGNEWTDNIYLTVDGANLNEQDYAVDDGNNGVLEPGENSDFTVTLKNIGSVNASNINAILSCADERLTVEDSVGFYNSVGAGGEATNNSDKFILNADSQLIPGSQIPMRLHLTNNDGYDAVISFLLEVGIVTANDPLGPDAYGYYCYDSGDSDYNLTPVYNWIEIDPSYGGNGSTVNLYDNGNSGDVQTINLPFDIYFYGNHYETVSVCSNGWLAPGETTQFSFMNWSIPGPLGPSPMIAPFWDDLRCISGAHVCSYYDENSHYFVVEWSHLQNEYNNAQETFEAIIYDADYYQTPTGDADILFQYKTVNNVDQGSYSGGYVSHGEYATVGLEDPSGTVGLEYTYSNNYPTAAHHLQNNFALFFTTRGSTIMEPPVAEINHNEFNFALPLGGTASQTLQISNLGEANLIYSITKDYQDDSTLLRDSGGPDSYGYLWKDSNEQGGPVYSWRDISGMGTEVNFTQNDTGTNPIPIGFSFNYYGTDYDNFRINPNGWIGFGNDNTAWTNTTIPSSSAPRPAILAFWDDLDPLQGGSVYYYGNSDSLIVWFDDVVHYPGQNNGTYNFEIIIYPNGRILMQYASVSGDLNSATIGIQNADGTIGLQVAYNSNYLENNLAILFQKVIDWVDVNPLNGFVADGQNQEVTISVVTSELEMGGTYLCNLLLYTNDPNASEITIPVNLTITDFLPDIDLSEETIDFGSQYVGGEYADTLTISNVGSDPLTIGNIHTESEFFTVDNTEFVLQPNESEDIIVTFSPTEEIEYNAILLIESDDPDEGELEVPLHGIGEHISGESNEEVSLTTALGKIFPNPLIVNNHSRSTNVKIDFSLAKKSPVKIKIYNLKGQLVRTLVNEIGNAGKYSATWNGKDNNRKDVASGMYFYKMEADKYSSVKKMILIR